MKNILFAYYPLFVKFSHAAALLTAVCREAGIDADYAECGVTLVDKMEGYDVIGFSIVTDADYRQCLPYMLYAKDRGKVVLVGGVYARRGGRVDSRFELVCRGEAEDWIAGYLLDGDMSMFDERKVREGIDGLPDMDLRHVTGYEFARGWPFLLGRKIVPYQSSRGCGYGECGFCEVRNLPEARGKVRMKHTIAADMERLRKACRPEIVYLFDEMPPYDREEWRAQWENVQPVPLMAYIRADIEPETLEWFIERGLAVASFGVESGDENVRNGAWNKSVSNEDIMRTVGILNNHGVVYIPTYITGYPGETDDDRETTKQAVEIIGGYPIINMYQELAKEE